MSRTSQAETIASAQALVTWMTARLRAAGLDEQGALLTATAPTLRESAPPARVAPPAVRCLPTALGLVTAAGVSDLVGPLESLAQRATWTRTAGYVEEPPYPDFPDRYAETTLLGPAANLPVAVEAGGAVAVGLLLLAPGTHYPPHAHPADEVYVPLTIGDWLDPRSGGYRRRAVGRALHHRPWQPHGMCAGLVPLLAVYLWTGSVDVPSRFCP